MYRADSVKVRQVFGTDTTDYLDGYQYTTNSILKFYPTAGSYFNNETEKYVYKINKEITND